MGWEGKALISNTLIYDSIYSQLVDNVTTIRLHRRRSPPFLLPTFPEALDKTPSCRSKTQHCDLFYPSQWLSKALLRYIYILAAAKENKFRTLSI